MAIDVLFFLIAGALAGGFINGLAGTGTALLTLGFWLQVVSPIQAVSMVLVIALISGIQGLFLVRHSINWLRLIRFLLPAILALPIGLKLLNIIDAGALKLLVATILIIYGGFFTFSKKLPALSKTPPLLDILIGFVSGVLASVGGLSGAIPTMWCAMQTWSKTEQRALLQPFNFVILLLVAVSLLYKGAYTHEIIINLTFLVPIALISSLIGMFVFKRISDNIFRRLLIALMLVSGLILLGQELLFQ